MNQEQIQQAARDEALVPTADRIKISTTNNYDLAGRNLPNDKNCKVDSELFRNILGISPRVPNEDFIVPLSEESMITFPYELGYKGQINKLSSMFVDHMHQPWRTLVAIINKCLSGKTSITPKKKDLITADDNIIPEPGVAFELGMSINRIEAEIAKEARRVHETHECLITEKPASKEDSDESEGEPANRSTGRRRSFEEQLVADMIQDIKARKIVSRSQPHTGGSKVPDEVKGKVHEEEIKWVSSDEDEDRKDDHDDDDDRSIDLEETYDEDEYAEYEAHADEYVHDVVDEEIKDVENAKTGKDDEEITDVEKEDAKKTTATKSDYKQVRKLPPTRSSLSVSSSFGNHFLNISSDISLIVPVLVIPEQTTFLPTSALPTETPVSTALLHAPSVTTISSVLKQTTPILTPSFTTVTLAVITAIPDPLPAVIQRLSDLKNNFKALTKKEQFKMCSQRIHLRSSSLRALYDAIAKGEIDATKVLKRSRPEDKDEDPSAGSNQRMKKRKKSKDAEPSKKTDQSGSTKGTTQSQPPSSSKYVQAEETIYEVAYTDKPLNHENDINNADDQPDAEVTPKTDKSTWFKQPPRPPTPDPEWNKGKAVKDGPE
ncbi:hypothetical protein Tco_1089970 [Tanacetum coccineum]|uniref:Ubinuclein middle domain-containing protein n=1 Tax=Tanacetum coccineum TaxID=301880 RepID=A0ABQ5I4G8_9ASTR